MDIFKVIGVGIIAAMLASFLKPQRPEIAMLIIICAGVVIFSITVPYINSLFSVFRDISAQAGIESNYLAVVIKIIGIAYVAQISSEICRDAGQGSVAIKIEIAAKLIIVVMSIPVMYKMLSVVTQLLQ